MSKPILCLNIHSNFFTSIDETLNIKEIKKGLKCITALSRRCKMNLNDWMIIKSRFTLFYLYDKLIRVFKNWIQVVLDTEHKPDHHDVLGIFITFQINVMGMPIKKEFQFWNWCKAENRASLDGKRSAAAVSSSTFVHLIQVYTLSHTFSHSKVIHRSCIESCVFYDSDIYLLHIIFQFV
jgi:hypothetical protein